MGRKQYPGGESRTEPSDAPELRRLLDLRVKRSVSGTEWMRYDVPNPPRPLSVSRVSLDLVLRIFASAFPSIGTNGI